MRIRRVGSSACRARSAAGAGGRNLGVRASEASHEPDGASGPQPSCTQHCTEMVDASPLGEIPQMHRYYVDMPLGGREGGDRRRTWRTMRSLCGASRPRAITAKLPRLGLWSLAWWHPSFAPGSSDLGLRMDCSSEHCSSVKREFRRTSVSPMYEPGDPVAM